MALNFWHAGGHSKPDKLFLTGSTKQHRCPFRKHPVPYKVGWAGLLFFTFSIAGAGRRCLELTARLSEISTLLTNQGVSYDPYDKSFHGVELTKNNSVALHIVMMAYREPRSILVDVPVGPKPNIRDSPEIVAALLPSGIAWVCFVCTESRLSRRISFGFLIYKKSQNDR